MRLLKVWGSYNHYLRTHAPRLYGTGLPYKIPAAILLNIFALIIAFLLPVRLSDIPDYIGQGITISLLTFSLGMLYIIKTRFQEHQSPGPRPQKSPWYTPWGDTVLILILLVPETSWPYARNMVLSREISDQKLDIIHEAVSLFSAKAQLCGLNSTKSANDLRECLSAPPQINRLKTFPDSLGNTILTCLGADIILRNCTPNVNTSNINTEEYEIVSRWHGSGFIKYIHNKPSSHVIDELFAGGFNNISKAMFATRMIQKEPDIYNYEKYKSNLYDYRIISYPASIILFLFIYMILGFFRSSYRFKAYTFVSIMLIKTILISFILLTTTLSQNDVKSIIKVASLLIMFFSAIIATRALVKQNAQQYSIIAANVIPDSIAVSALVFILQEPNVPERELRIYINMYTFLVVLLSPAMQIMQQRIQSLPIKE